MVACGKVDDSTIRPRLLVVKTDYPAGFNLQSRAYDLVARHVEICSGILVFFGLFETLSIIGFDSHEYLVEARVNHKVQQLLVLGQIHRHLTIEIKPLAARSIPADQCVQQNLGIPPVSYKVVVNKEDVFLPAETAEHIQFVDDLGGGFGSDFASQHKGDVTEFTLKRA